MHLQLGLTIHHCEGQMFVFVISKEEQGKYAVAPVSGAKSFFFASGCKIICIWHLRRSAIEVFRRCCGGGWAGLPVAKILGHDDT